MSSTVQLRIDISTKKKAQKILGDMGLDLSSAIKLFLTQVIKRKSIPFQIRTANGFTPEEEMNLLNESFLAKKHGKRFGSTEEMMKYLHN